MRLCINEFAESFDVTFDDTLDVGTEGVVLETAVHADKTISTDNAKINCRMRTG
jgi:hypothetical protein